MKCGVGAYTQRLAVALTEYGDMQVTVLTDVRASEAVTVNGIEVLSIVRGWGMIELFRIARYIKQLNPDVVHIQYPTQGYSGRMPRFLPLLMRLLAKPCVQTWHEPVLGWSGVLLAIGLRVLVTVREDFMGSIPKLTQKALKRTKLIWIPAASLLPTAKLSDEQRLKFRQSYASENDVLLTYYGFVAPLKGIEALFEIVAKTNARLLMACDFLSDDDYHRSLLDNIAIMGIASRITIMGFLPEDQLASILASSDAVVLPFRDGAGAWNTSIDGAVAQGVFVLSTSVIVNGYNNERNIYFAKPGNVDEMIAAIQKYAGQHIACKQPILEWRNIAEQHLNVYKQLVLI